MLDVAEIRRRLADGRYVLSDHALARVVERDIIRRTIAEAGATSELIEDYPDDKYSPSCLLRGYIGVGLPLHLHGSRVDRAFVKIITVYEPDPALWIESRVRRT